MKININIKFGSNDSFKVEGNGVDKTIEVTSVTTPHTEQLHCANNIFNILKQSELIPSETILDLLNLSLAVYTADQLVSRNVYGYYHWNRYFEIYIPVTDLKGWQSVKDDLTETLSFLSGDKWKINFRKRDAFYKEPITRNNAIREIDKVSLFSGGLDSLIGAIDLLNNDEKIVLVGHHKKGGHDLDAQKKLVNELHKEFSKNIIYNHQFYVQPEFENNKDLAGEDTQRARSFLFLTLGIAVANSYGEEIPLIIPENGLISLNIPLTPTRLGTYSTKTTHPYFLRRFAEILKRIGINNSLQNPYQFKTKGEMIVDCQRHHATLLSKISNNSISCSKPGYYTRWRKKGTPDITEVQCGHCIPCIIRRAAMHKGGIDKFEGNYVFDVKSFERSDNKGRGADLHAFKIGIQKYLTQNKLTIFELLKSGALPEDDINKYLGVAKNGFEEVKKFILDN